jgi:jumonji domain-containing protein 2
VPPSERDQLERRLLEHNKGARPPCSQFVRHMSAWVLVEVLEWWDIAYIGVEQRPGELVVTAPGAYHQGWNAGWNVAGAVNYGDGACTARIRGYRH